jgi:hypothetical protein
LVVKLLFRLTLTMSLEAAKNARTWEMKWHLVLDSLVQSAWSTKKLISSAVQKEAFGFLVHPPYVSMVDRKEYKAVWIFLQKRFRSKESFVFGNLVF